VVLILKNELRFVSVMFYLPWLITTGEAIQEHVFPYSLLLGVLPRVTAGVQLLECLPSFVSDGVSPNCLGSTATVVYFFWRP
jgi:hypothetical protein